MKKLLILMFVAVIMPLTALGQTKQINEILDKYEKRKGVESIIISPSLLQIASSTDVDASTKDLLSKITEMRILNIKSGAVENGIPIRLSLRKELDGLIVTDMFKRIVMVKDGEETLEMYTTSTAQGVLLFFTTNPSEFSVISIFGNIDKTVVNAAMSGAIKVK
ncbi:MAG: hypothetical protein CVU13_10610 [Bacteroidetes bacterium HGW-Bacteroidetes-8]|jgi:hypothetical protein|nr:MAG: hypothetical protein CVU13_10610 [Bacteroidetes bacterium HGW-Bacteroidetes-8]